MGEIKRFIEKNTQYIELFLSSSIFLILLLTVIHLTGIVDVNMFIRFRHLVFILFSLISLYTLLRYRRSNNKEIFKKVFRGSFLGVLVLQVLSVNNISFSFTFINNHSVIFNNYAQHINFLFVVFSLLLLFTHKKEINEKKEKDISNKWAYVILVGILVLFTWIKAPYFEYNFTGEHTMKYNTYVEPAKYMAERGDFTWYQQKYLGNPISNPQGIRNHLPQLPLLEWSLATSYLLLPGNSIELNTRLVTHTIGIVTLLFTFLLVKKWSNNIYALITTTLMATNAIVAFATFVTVYDGINFMLLLISLFLLTNYLKEKKKLHLLLFSGILLGLGASIKISFLIWALPTTLLFILYKNKELPKKVFDFVTLYLFAGGVYLITKFSIPSLRMDTSRSVLMFLGGTTILIGTYLLIKKFREEIMNFLINLNQKKVLVPSVVVIIAIVTPLVFNFVADDNLLKNFLTDRNFIFNIPFYRYMIVNQFIPFVTLPLFLMSIVGFVFLPFIKNKRIKQINIIFFISAVFFWIVASKSIFPHSYYTEIIVLALLLGSTTLIYFVLRTFKSLFFKVLFLLLISILVFPVAIANTEGYLSIQIPGFEEAAKYLENNTEEDEIYIDESYLLSLTLETGRARVGDINAFSDEEFKHDVRNLGFKDAMEKYNVTYLITRNAYPDYESYAHIFSEEYLESTEFDRGQILLSFVDPEDYSYYSDSDLRKELVEEYNLESKFVFEKRIGEYRFFRFEN